MEALFTKFSNNTARWSGHYTVFFVAVLLVVLWAVSGPFLDFSPTWQLLINTSTTVITFLMVFLIQGTQNRSDKALHLKLDEILRVIEGTNERIVDAEEDTEREMDELKSDIRSNVCKDS